MNKELTVILFILLIAGFAIGGFYLINLQRKKERRQLEDLKTTYLHALKSGTKSDALQAGRKYYSFLRNGKLSIYDEQAITNDLSTMQA